MAREEVRDLRPTARPVDLDTEEEIDLGRYGTALAARWWLPLLGLVAGIVAGFLLALGGTQVYRANVLVDLGTPLGPGGGPAQSVSALVTQAREIVTAEATLRRVAVRSGIPVRRLRGSVQAQAVSANPTRAPTAPLLSITVQGEQARRVAAAANGLGREVVRHVSPYVSGKIVSLGEQISAHEDQIATLDEQIATLRAGARSPGLSIGERLILVSQASDYEQRRESIRDDLYERRSELSFARDVERAEILVRAVPTQTSARSRRTSMVVGGAIGLLLGLLAAVAWDSVAAAFARRRD